jgi:uncharacterized protein YqgC (DUF456 family)
MSDPDPKPRESDGRLAEADDAWVTPGAHPRDRFLPVLKWLPLVLVAASVSGMWFGQAAGAAQRTGASAQAIGALLGIAGLLFSLGMIVSGLLILVLMPRRRDRAAGLLYVGWGVAFGLSFALMLMDGAPR